MASPAPQSVLAPFHPAVRTWFERKFPEGPTEPQVEGWPAIADNVDTLIAAPTGSGKTLSAFLVCIDRQLTADSAYADLILPATTMFEIESYMTYGPIFRIRERLIEPIGEARNDYLIMAELARRLGYGERFPQTEEELLRCE